MVKFCNRLKEVMEEKNISQTVLADYLNVKQPTISRYIRGVQEPNFDMLIRIAEYLEVSLDYLLGRKDY